MSKKKALIAILTNNDDDIYCFRKELIERLILEGYEILISCPEGPKFELMSNISFKFDNPLIDRRGTNVFADFKLLIHYWKLFREMRPAVVLTYTAKPGVYGSLAARFLGIPYINNITGLGSVLCKKGLMRVFIMNLFKLAYSGATCIMFQNDTNMKLAKELGWVRGDYMLIPGSGVSLERYPVQDYPKGGNGIEGEKVVFNYIGRILHDKGVDDYIEVAKRIKKDYPNTEFNMIGFIEPTESHYEKKLKVLGEQGIINYYGNQKDVKPFIAKAHAIIHPSTYGEGMSNVLLENASSGRFLITTDNPGCRETVNDGVTGYIYKGGDVDEMENVVKKFLVMDNEERKKMGLRGRKKMEEEFSREVVVNAYLDKIKGLKI